MPFSFCEEASFRKINISMVKKHYNFKGKSKFGQSCSPIFLILLILALGFMSFEIYSNIVSHAIVPSKLLLPPQLKHASYAPACRLKN